MPDPKVSKGGLKIFKSEPVAEHLEGHNNGVAARPWAMDASNPTSDFEAPKDPGAHKPHTNLTDNEILGHRSVYVGINVPCSGGSQRRHHHHHHHHNSGRGHGRSHRHRGRHHHLKSNADNGSSGSARPVTPPSQRVKFILGEDQEDSGHEPHPLFSEMGELVCDAKGDMEWHETARWVKFEEDVEEGGNRWSKPHVGTLSLHSLFELRCMLLNGTVCLDMSANNLDDISELLLDNMINSNQVTYDKKAIVKEAINKRHRHQYEGVNKHDRSEGFIGSTANNMSRLPIIRSLADMSRMSSSKSNSHIKNSGDSMKRSGSSEGLENGVHSKHFQANNQFMKKIPKGAEASNILVGELNALDKPLPCFVRLTDACILGDLTEVPVPTRFLFILLGPGGEDKVNLARYHEIGRAVATIMSDEVFHDVAYKAKKREHLLAGLDEFLDAVTVLPPGEWDPSIRIEPPSNVPSQDSRKQGGNGKKDEAKEDEDEEANEREHSGLVRTGRIFGGLMNDVKRKRPFYASDFKDGLALQSVASFIFIYFACLTPIITFGGLLGDATHNRMSAIESLVAGLIVGVVYGLFSGQPLTILGSTGPILVFETILFDFCEGMQWDYLSFRFCIGMWIFLILLVLVATDASAFVCYITRFTEENFATLIAFIFIKKSFQKVMDVHAYYPLHKSDCFCIPDNATELELYGKAAEGAFVAQNETKYHHFTCHFTPNGTDAVLHGEQSVGCHYVPNAFLMSVLLFLGTFLIAFQLKKFKTWHLFPMAVKNFFSDFAVIIAIFSMTLLDVGVAVDTPKLRVPAEFRPTWEGRGWLIHPIGNNPWWTSLVAFVPAVLGTILIFMDQQITAVIVNRKENRLVKGCGYHLDLFVVAILIAVCSVLGLPWFVAATVLSINHVKSLTRESETAAPGEKPQFLGIREQRLTHICIFIMIGLSVLITPVLSMIPMPVLYGVFLYMGVASLNGLQFFDRILIIFMPKKYQPDLPVLRRVPLRRVHLFTAIQFLCLVGLWVIKEIKSTSVLFPVMLVFMLVVRKGLDKVFDKNELNILDDILPEFQRHKKLDDEEAFGLDGGDQMKDPPSMDSLSSRRKSLRVTNTSIAVPMANGNVMMIPMAEDQMVSNDSCCAINITEEVNRSGVWTSLEGNNKAAKKQQSKSHELSFRKRQKRMSVVAEMEDGEEDAGITIKASED